MENLGKFARDQVTGFEGIITSKHLYLTGCSQYGLQPRIDKDSKLQQKEYFDSGRVEILHDGIIKDDVHGEKDGCDFREHP